MHCSTALTSRILCEQCAQQYQPHGMSADLCCLAYRRDRQTTLLRAVLRLLRSLPWSEAQMCGPLQKALQSVQTYRHVCKWIARKQSFRSVHSLGAAGNALVQNHPHGLLGTV